MRMGFTAHKQYESIQSLAFLKETIKYTGRFTEHNHCL